eukprot:s76_g13.t1
MPGLPTNVFAMVFLCLVGSRAVSHDASCGDCMEHIEENVLVQLANLQPDLGSNSNHPPPTRRFRRLRRRFRFGRYGAKTTPAPAESTTRAPGGTTAASPTTTRATTTEASPASTSTEATTTNPVETTESTGTSARSTTTEATASTTTTTTRVVCTGANARLELDADPAQNEFTLVSPETSPECQCVGGRYVPSATPGWLDVSVSGVGDPKSVSSISITSPNATEVKVSPLTTGNDGLRAGTVLFNGFQGVGNWTVKLLDAVGNPSQTGTSVVLRFTSIGCSQISPTPACVGNVFTRGLYVAQNFSLVGTTLSTSPSLLQFDVDVSSSCCVPAFSSSVDNIELRLGFTTAPTEVRAEGLSLDAIPFNLTGSIFVSSVRLYLTPGFVGSPAAGLWNLSAFMESGSAVIDDASQAPELRMRVEPC